MLASHGDDLIYLIQVGLVVLPTDRFRTRPHHSQSQEIQSQFLHPFKILSGHRNVFAELPVVWMPWRAFDNCTGAMKNYLATLRIHKGMRSARSFFQVDGIQSCCQDSQRKADDECQEHSTTSDGPLAL